MSHLSMHSYLFSLEPTARGPCSCPYSQKLVSFVLLSSVLSLQISFYCCISNVLTEFISFFPWNTFCWIFPTSLTIHFSSLHPPLFCLPSNVSGLCLFWTPVPNCSSPGMECHSASACLWLPSSSPLNLVYICSLSLLLPEDTFHESIDLISVYPFISKFQNNIWHVVHTPYLAWSDLLVSE